MCSETDFILDSKDGSSACASSHHVSKECDGDRIGLGLGGQSLPVTHCEDCEQLR